MDDASSSPPAAVPSSPALLYRSDRAEVWHGSGEAVLSAMGTESAHLAVTDPPYGVAWQSGMRTRPFEQLHNDGPADRSVVAAVLSECVRVVGQKRHLYVFGPTDVLEGLKVSETCQLIWDKGRAGMGDLTSTWGPAHEPITFAVSMHRHAGKTGTSVLPVRLRKGTVLPFSPPTGRNVRHPSEKPVALLRELIESSSRQGELIVDPFAGSGSTGVAAILSGRRVVLAESDLRWARMAVERVHRADVAAAAGMAA